MNILVYSARVPGRLYAAKLPGAGLARPDFAAVCSWDYWPIIECFAMNGRSLK